MPYTDKSKPPKKVLQSHPISFLVSDTILYKETSVLCREGEIYLGREDYKWIFLETFPPPLGRMLESENQE